MNLLFIERWTKTAIKGKIAFKFAFKFFIAVKVQSLKNERRSRTSVTFSVQHTSLGFT